MRIAFAFGFCIIFITICYKISAVCKNIKISKTYCVVNYIYSVLILTKKELRFIAQFRQQNSNNYLDDESNGNDTQKYLTFNILIF